MQFTDEQLQGEEWRAVDGFPGYDISSIGRCRSWWTVGRHSRIGSSCRILRWIRNTNGYFQVCLSRDRKKSKHLVHVLVVTAFREARPSGMEAAHEDGNQSNNSIGNIFWKTHVENCADRIRHGTNLFGERIWSAKFTSYTVTLLQWLRNDQECRLTDLADWFGVSKGTVWTNCNGRQWTRAEQKRSAA
jgi:hypothetical protein